MRLIFRAMKAQAVLLRRLALTFLAFAGASSLRAETLRVVSYNIEADVNGNTRALPGLTTVLEAIGEQKVGNVIQPFDILGLEETTSNTTTVQPIVNSLNSYYGANTYAMTSYQATQNGGADTGNGPNSLIYNQTTLQLVASKGVGTPQGSTNGEYRQVVRYQFRPVGGTATNDFYVYVSHMKSSASGTPAADQSARNKEAQIIRADAATLPTGASILYTGDFNMDGSFEAAYQTLTASGTGQAIDPLNFPLQDNNEVWNASSFKGILTEASTGLSYRDDIQFMSLNVYQDTSATGLQYLSGSYRAFGNDGTTAFGASVNLGSNTALNNLFGSITAAQTLSALTTASDHLPIVADFLITVPEPNSASLVLLAAGMHLLWRLKRR